MVKIFTTPTCSICFALKEFLKEHNVEFEEVDISSDKIAREEIIKRTGQMGVPVIEINNEIIVGFNKKRISELLGIKD